jgi:hypothetical protein
LELPSQVKKEYDEQLTEVEAKLSGTDINEFAHSLIGVDAEKKKTEYNAVVKARDNLLEDRRHFFKSRSRR